MIDTANREVPCPFGRPRSSPIRERFDPFRYLDIDFPFPTLARNILGRNQKLSFGFHSRNPYRDSYLSRASSIEAHAKATSDTPWFPCCRSPARVGRRAVGQRLRPAGRRARNQRIKDRPLRLSATVRRSLPGARFSVARTMPFVSPGKACLTAFVSSSFTTSPIVIARSVGRSSLWMSVLSTMDVPSFLMY